MAVNIPTAPWYHGQGTHNTQFSQAEARSFCRRLVSSDTYRKKLETDLNLRLLPPAIEQMLWHYAYGKPVETINVNANNGPDLSSMSSSELGDYLKTLQDKLNEAKALEDAIDAVPTSSTVM